MGSSTPYISISSFCGIFPSSYALLTAINLIVALIIFGVIGYALIELARQMFKRHPWKGVRYGNTPTSDAVARAMLGEDFGKCSKNYEQTLRPHIKFNPERGLNAVDLMDLSNREWNYMTKRKKGMYPELDRAITDEHNNDG